MTKQEERREYDLKRRYGITIKQYNKMLKQQKYCCKICGRHQDTCKKNLFVDHNHLEEPIKVRGLLCYSCNIGIAYLREDINILMNAIKYLAKGNN